MDMRFIFILTVALYSFSGFAQEYQSPRTLGLGGAGRAGPLLNDTIYLNPSFGSFAQSYNLSGGYLWFAQARSYNFSIQDSRTEWFQAGAGYTWHEHFSAINIGASKMMVERLGAGIGSKIIIDRRTGKFTTDFSLSSSFIALPWIYTAFIIDNVIQSKEARTRGLYRTFYLGTKATPDELIQVFFDPHYTPDLPGSKKFGMNLGSEIKLLADFYFRIGRFFDSQISHLNRRGTGTGYGVGWIGPRLSLEGALLRTQNEENVSSLLLSIFI